MFDPNDVSKDIPVGITDLGINAEGEELNDAEQNAVTGAGDIYGSSGSDGS